MSSRKSGQRMNVMDLFKKAAESSQESHSVQSKDDDRFSEIGSFDRVGSLCAANNIVCVSKGDFLEVCDVRTNARNDANVSNSLLPIVDISINASSNIVLYTDGINVALLKVNCSSGIHLNGCVFLPQVGSTSDPIKLVRFHGGPNFVTVQANGWTLWDTARLIMKASISETELLPDLFRSCVLECKKFTEDFIPWKKNSNIFAGKKVSPGVLAILKRGTSPEMASESVSSGDKILFEFSKNGKYALAVVDNVLRGWKIGPNCATIDVLQVGVSLPGRKFVACAPGADIFTLAAAGEDDSLICRLHVNEKNELVVERIVTLISKVFSLCSSGDNVIALSPNEAVLIKGFADIVPIDSPANATRVCADGRSIFWQTEMDGTTRWFSSRILQDDISEPAVEMSDEETVQAPDGGSVESNYDGDDGSESPETVEAPDRLVSQPFAHAPVDTHISDWAAQVTNGQDAIDAQIQAKIDRLVRSQVAEAVRDKLVRFEQTERDKTLRIVKAVLKKQFAQGMHELFNSVFARIESHTISFQSLEKQIDQLIAKTEAQPAQQSPMDAISALTTWWKQSDNSQPNIFVAGCLKIRPSQVEALEDPSMSCFNLMVLTEWLRQRPDAGVLECARFVVNCLVAHEWNVSGEVQELCSKSLSKSIRNAVGACPTDLVENIRGLMMRLGAVSRATTPPDSRRTSNAQGSSILQMLQKRQ